MAKEKLTHICYNCECTFTPKVPDRNKFCSRDCSYKFLRIKKNMRAEARVSFTVIINEGCSPKLKPAINRYAFIITSNCRACGVGFSRLEAGTTRYMCSASCLSEANKVSDRRSKSKRRALERGANVGVLIDPIKVFERDVWKCQLCGVKTPQSRRGTHDDKAPELDHILPISKGGKHDWDNVQCACRKCNIAKGAIPKGQLLLFPSS